MFRITVFSALVVVLFLSAITIAAQEPSNTASKPVSYGIVIDNSGSYRTLLERVISFTHAVKDKNSDADEAFLVTFINASKIKVRQELTSDKSQLGEAIDNMFVEGGISAVLDAVRFSIDYLTANVNERGARYTAILLISDGDDGGSSAKLETVIAAAKDANVRIVVLGLSDEKLNTKLLEKLARGTGGSAFFPRTPKEMTEIAPTVAAALRKR
jgi:Ca-activated chloride channel family protein